MLPSRSSVLYWVFVVLGGGEGLHFGLTGDVSSAHNGVI